MKPMMLVVRRDLAAYFNSLWGYVVIAAILVIDGLLFNSFSLGSGAKYSTKVLEEFFYFSFGTTMVAAVLLTMRLIAEERQTGTDTLLDASPLTDWQIVVGKYLSALVFLSLLTLTTLYMPALIFVNGKVSAGQIAAGYGGLLLAGSAAVAVGTFGSAVARNQLFAAVISSFLVVFFLVSWMLARKTEAPFSEVFSYMSLFDKHFQPFMRGRVNLDGIVYYITLTYFFLMLSVRWMSTRRWR
jgi:ABC-2 type transport system permease protein